MEIVSAVLMGIGILLPSMKKLLDSMAYRNRARGQAEIIRARRGGTRKGRADD
ncbi:hypothetical protein ACFU9B_39390 [Streptomyces sp. NPDC057592]|uniref:hypothetical protein n=1 Tax=unclassified Streptomyces TaxID=2593676 RepID=UPI0036CF8F5E